MQNSILYSVERENAANALVDVELCFRCTKLYIFTSNSETAPQTSRKQQQKRTREQKATEETLAPN
jgi:hypothetical protein